MNLQLTLQKKKKKICPQQQAMPGGNSSHLSNAQAVAQSLSTSNTPSLIL
jgi:hypothetical protein